MNATRDGHGAQAPKASAPLRAGSQPEPEAVPSPELNTALVPRVEVDERALAAGPAKVSSTRSGALSQDALLSAAESQVMAAQQALKDSWRQMQAQWRQRRDPRYWIKRKPWHALALAVLAGHLLGRSLWVSRGPTRDTKPKRGSHR